MSQEDDEFEEFQQQEWTAADEDAEDKTMWQASLLRAHGKPMLKSRAAGHGKAMPPYAHGVHQWKEASSD